MKPKKIFRTSLFGYNKKDVFAYMNKYAKAVKKKHYDHDDEITSIETELKELKDERNNLLDRLNELENEQKKADGIIAEAQKRADNIIKAAEDAARQKRSELEVQAAPLADT